MPARKILLFGNPVLQTAAAAVERFDGELGDLVGDLLESGWKAPGLGVAAPQIGISLALAVVDLSVGKDPDARLVLANPQITATQGRVSLEEGCLSFPLLFTSITRPRAIRVSAQDATGKRREIEAEGLLAQAICHEIDHLRGVLLVDHLRGLKRRMFFKRVKKMRDSGAW